RVADQPEGLDVLAPDLFDHTCNDVLEVLVIGGGPDPGWRVRGCNNKTVLVFVVHDWKIVTLPVPVRPGAMKTKNKGHLFSRLEIAWIIEEVGATGFDLDRGPLVDHSLWRAVLVGTLQKGQGSAGYARELDRLLGVGVSSEASYDGHEYQRSEQLE